MPHCFQAPFQAQNYCSTLTTFNVSSTVYLAYSQTHSSIVYIYLYMADTDKRGYNVHVRVVFNWCEYKGMITHACMHACVCVCVCVCVLYRP